jgi:hypothetical protein
MANVLRTTRTGTRSTTSTATSAIRTRCPAKTCKRWLAGSRSIRSNLAFATRQRVPSSAMRNLRQRKLMDDSALSTVALATRGSRA